MSNVDEADVQKWILLTLYKKPRSIKEIFANGCKIMVYGREPNEFKRTLSNMTNKGLIKYISQSKDYEISEDGVFKIHKDVFLPYLDLDQNAIDTLISKLKKGSDREFISSLKNRDDGTKKSFIIQYSEKHLSNVLAIISIIVTLSVV